jgi:hypothetical protein
VLSVLDGHGLSVGLISCNKDEMDIFHTATIAQIGNEKKTQIFGSRLGYTVSLPSTLPSIFALS